MTFFQLFIISYLVLFWVVLGLRILLVKQKTGVNPVIPYPKEGIQGIVRLFAFFGQSCLISSVLCYSLLMDLYQYFVLYFSYRFLSSWSWFRRRFSDSSSYVI